MAIEALDQASDILAKPLNVSSSAWTDAFGPELLVMLEEIPAGLLLTGLGRLAIGVVTGLGALAYVTMGNLSGRDKEAAMHTAAHFLTHPNAAGLWGIATASVATPTQLAAEIQNLKAGVAAQNLDQVRSAFAFNPGDITSYFQGASAQLQSLLSIPAAAVAPSAPLAATATPEGTIATQLVQAVTSYGEVF